MYWCIEVTKGQLPWLVFYQLDSNERYLGRENSAEKGLHVGKSMGHFLINN